MYIKTLLSDISVDYKSIQHQCTHTHTADSLKT